jgi:predicted MPP superfamily phosphohydrolase
MTIRSPSELLRQPAAPVEGITRRGLLMAGLGLSGAALALPGTAAYAGMEAATGLVVTDYRMSPPGWPADRRLTIAVIADLHAGGPNMGLERVSQVVDSANGLGCDLVVLLGDYFATHRFVTEHVPPPAWAGELARLRAPLGVYAIYGNHDWWYNIAGVRDAFMNARIPAMQNEAILLSEKGNRFWLAGLGDQLTH